jgi:hypothetical protein
MALAALTAGRSPVTLARFAMASALAGGMARAAFSHASLIARSNTSSSTVLRLSGWWDMFSLVTKHLLC